MDTTTVVEVVNVKPIEFGIILKMDSNQDVDEWIAGVKLKHPSINHMLLQWGSADPHSGIAICELRVVLHDDTDYQQLCALRAELKA